MFLVAGQEALAKKLHLKASPTDIKLIFLVFNRTLRVQNKYFYSKR